MVLESGYTFRVLTERGPGVVNHLIQSVLPDVTEGDMVEVAGKNMLEGGNRGEETNTGSIQNGGGPP